MHVVKLQVLYHCRRPGTCYRQRLNQVLYQDKSFYAMQTRRYACNAATLWNEPVSELRFLVNHH